MSSKKSKKNAVKVPLSLPRVSLAELVSANAFAIEAGRNGDERYVGFAADVDFLREAYSTLAIEGNLEMLEWIAKVGIDSVGAGLLGKKGWNQFRKLVKGYGLIEPQILQPLYRKVQVPGIPFLFTPEVDEKVFERSEAFEHIVLHKAHYTKDSGPGSGGSSYTTTKIGTRTVEELVFDSADADTEMAEGFTLPYARARGDFSVVGWKDNVSFCARSVEGPKAPSNGNPGKSGDVLTYTGRDGEDRKVLAVYVSRVFPTQELYIDAETGYEKVRQLAPARLLSDVVQTALQRALANGGQAWNQFRALVNASKEYNLAMRERTVGEGKNGRHRVWTMKMGPLTIFSQVAFKDLPKAEQERLTHSWAVQHEIRTKLEELTNLQAALDLPLNKGNDKLAIQVAELVRDLHKRILETESYWAFKSLKPWYSIIFANDAPVSFDDLI